MIQNSITNLTHPVQANPASISRSTLLCFFLLKVLCTSFLAIQKIPLVVGLYSVVGKLKYQLAYRSVSLIRRTTKFCVAYHLQKKTKVFTSYGRKS